MNSSYATACATKESASAMNSGGRCTVGSAIVDSILPLGLSRVSVGTVKNRKASVACMDLW